MVMQVGPGRPVPVVFTGKRIALAGLLVRGYALLIPTIGLYRFWLTTWKRRFYWSNTEIDGDALEYTGNAAQLLIGFLMALAVFVPLYGIFFYLSTQSSTAAITGYGVIGVLLWFLTGYAIYRARDFRLSRTLWRGIRFDQTGSAWGYAARRFGWSLLVVATAGLAYPFMAASLWRYRYRYSWYGDRQFGFVGGWKHLAWPFYRTYVLVAVVAALGLGVASSMGAFADLTPHPLGYLPLATAAGIAGLLVLHYRASEMTRMFSSVRLGTAVLTVKISTAGLLGQYLLFGVALIAAYVVLAVGGFVVLSAVAPAAFAGGNFDLSVLMGLMRSSPLALAVIILGYLLILGAFSLMGELFLGLAFWKLVTGGASIAGIQSLRTVGARAEDKALAGEGLADALNVGAY